MKYNNLILKIEKPCNEDFDLMTTNANGKFCNHCSKSVLDLTNLTDDEIFETLNKTKGKICGRLANDQLNRLLVKRNNNIYHTRLYKILAGLLLIGTTKETLATEPNLRSETQFIIENEEKNNQTYSLIKDETTDSAIVEVSSNGGTNWTIVASYVSLQGINSSTFGNPSINLNSYVDKSNLKIRFRY